MRRWSPESEGATWVLERATGQRLGPPRVRRRQPQVSWQGKKLAQRAGCARAPRQWFSERPGTACARREGRYSGIRPRSLSFWRS